MIPYAPGREPVTDPAVDLPDALPAATWLAELVEGKRRIRKFGALAMTQLHREVAFELLRELNREIAHDGAWRVCWTDPVPWPQDFGGNMILENLPDKIELQWCDVDGDVQLVVEIEERMQVILDMQIGHWLQQAEEAWQQLRDWKRDVDVRPEQTIKRVKGQMPRDPTVQPAL